MAPVTLETLYTGTTYTANGRVAAGCLRAPECALYPSNRSIPCVQQSLKPATLCKGWRFLTHRLDVVDGEQAPPVRSCRLPDKPAAGTQAFAAQPTALTGRPAGSCAARALCGDVECAGARGQGECIKTG